MESGNNGYNNGEIEISIGQIFGVLIGNWKIFIAMALAFAIISGIIVYPRIGNGDYVGAFGYRLQQLNDEQNIDGTLFNIHQLVSLDYLEKYKQENESLSSLDMEELYAKGAISSIETFVERQERALQEKTNSNGTIIVPEENDSFYIVLKNAFFTKEQATALVKAVANEPINKTKSLLSQINYTNLFTYYEEASDYQQKVALLNDQFDFLCERYEALLTEYGNAIIPDGYFGGTEESFRLVSLRLKDVLDGLKNYFHVNVENDLENLKNELNTAGYIDDNNIASQQRDYETRREVLVRNQDVAIEKRDSLLQQQKDILASTADTQLQSVQLDSYNARIIQLSEEIIDLGEQIDLIDIKLSNIDERTRNNTYSANKKVFEEKLEKFRKKLYDATLQYTDIEKYLIGENNTLYYVNNTIVKQQEGFSLIKALLVVFVAAVFLPMLVNFVIFACMVAADNRYVPKKKRETEKK